MGYLPSHNLPPLKLTVVSVVKVPCGTSCKVINGCTPSSPSFVKSDVLVGTGISTVLLVIGNSVPFFFICSITFTWAPGSIPESLVFSASV